MTQVNWRSPYVGCLLVLTLMMCLYDGYARFYSGSVGHSKNNTLESFSLPKIVFYDQQDIDGVLALYDKYRADDEEIAAEQKIMSQEQQEQQSGELNKVFVGDNQLALKAVLLNGTGAVKQATVLLDVVNLKNRTNKLHSFTQNSNVFGYTLSSISNTQVELTKQATNQHIVLTMYQPNNKSKGN
ncbi:hypothetical protein CBQ28_03690 [Pseudoalteromonas sp. GCY]|uniref:hypothetical protein n=1 Tax=Pseudoalteromonas sp. GCY TaxID=2003316 RepID=UPI000BFEE61F|nr:hypothetical protein [Pseudoalteromonas sp. GCY]PHI38631.1 hypothetical protein CBQ28_03690 [Pseudoalteromonas sp. GCY]QQQ67724.1 hypothetical protein JJQ94_07895 [Pseudoalteromonas sp. GCY]